MSPSILISSVFAGDLRILVISRVPCAGVVSVQKIQEVRLVLISLDIHTHSSL